MCVISAANTSTHTVTIYILTSVIPTEKHVLVRQKSRWTNTSYEVKSFSVSRRVFLHCVFNAQIQYILLNHCLPVNLLGKRKFLPRYWNRKVELVVKHKTGTDSELKLQKNNLIT